jgi:hypothetical protein
VEQFAGQIERFCLSARNRCTWPVKQHECVNRGMATDAKHRLTKPHRFHHEGHEDREEGILGLAFVCFVVKI